MNNIWRMSLLPVMATSIGLGLAAPSAQAAAWRDGTPRTAYVQLFEWKWDSIAKECTNFLGPKGFSAVQVSPPNEHKDSPQWWALYQPISYQLNSRLGDRAQFKRMIDTCKAAGVDVYVDVVINHMANGTGRGSSGSSYDGSLNFSGVPYNESHFHSACIPEYNSSDRRDTVTECWMGRVAGGDVGLPDLNTADQYVQGKVADYLNDLRSLGVAGFRIDAAKHIRPNELRAILDRVPGNYFVTQEIIRDGSYQKDIDAYFQIGTVNEFNLGYAVRNGFLNDYGFNLSRLPEAFQTWGFFPSDKSTVFVANHDTERSGCTNWGPGGKCNMLNTYLPEKLHLANIFMLGYDFGYPQLISGYYFNSHDMSPPSSPPYAGDEAAPSNCSSSFNIGKWDCSHRDWRTANMVGFRNYTAGARVEGWQAEGTDRISFRRAGKGFVAINNSGSSWQASFNTGLPDGKYCNVTASAEPENGTCPANTQVNVSGGQATLSVEPNSAVAIHLGAKVKDGPVDDRNPDNFDFPAIANAAAGSTQTSASVRISGINVPVAISIANGLYSINGGAFTAAAGTLNAGQTLTLRTTASAAAGASKTVTVKVGERTEQWTVVTVNGPDKNPDDFNFPGINDAAPGSTQTSATVTITGISVPVALSVGNGLYSIKGGAFTAAAGTIKAGQKLTLRTAASATPGASKTVTVKVGERTEQWTVVTRGGQDRNPDNFDFPAVVDVALGSTQTSNTITLRGVNTTVPVTISNGLYSVDGGAFTAAAGTMRNGQTLTLRATAPSTASTSKNVVVKVGERPELWVVRTRSGGACLHSYCPSASPIDSFPARSSITAGKEVTLYYNGRLAAKSGKLNLYWSANGWTKPIVTSAMSKLMQVEGDYWMAKITVPDDAKVLNFVFNNGAEWDNNNRSDWNWTVNPCSSSCGGGSIELTFKVNSPTLWGESVYIVGNQAELGNWSTGQDAGRKCSPDQYPIWTCKIKIDKPGTTIEYKYIKLGRGVYWEGGHNRTYVIPANSTIKNDGAWRPQ